jgi:Flp pilus assembly protein TadG
MRKRQTGAAIVEFALVAVVFLTVLLSIMDFGRVLFLWNSAAEATLLGARLSVVCNNLGGTNDGFDKVLATMQQYMPIQAANLTVNWYDNSGNISATCDSTNCAGVSVSISGLTIKPVSPLAWIGFSTLTVPAFTTYLPREIMGQDPQSNTVCI